MNILQAIEKLANQNQRLVDKYGVSDLTRFNDDIRNSIIDYYMQTKDYENQSLILSNEYFDLLKDLNKYKSILKLFSFDLNELNGIPYEIINLIDIQKIGQLYGFFNISVFRLFVEDCFFNIRQYLHPIKTYYSFIAYEELKQWLRALYPDFNDWFNMIDDDPFNFDNIIYSAYKSALSRLSIKDYVYKNPLYTEEMVNEGWKQKELNGIPHFYKN